jgi:hypothetical protein
MDIFSKISVTIFIKFGEFMETVSPNKLITQYLWECEEMRIPVGWVFIFFRDPVTNSGLPPGSQLHFLSNLQFLSPIFTTLSYLNAVRLFRALSLL